MQDFFFENKGLKIHCTAWSDVDRPIGTVLLVHDMGEYCKRYDDFALFLNANGYLVVSLDLRAHGRTCGGYDHRGEIEGDCFADSVDDLYKLACYALSEFRLPLAMMGMGYGALLAQAFAQQYGDKLHCSIWIGTTQANLLLSVGGLAVVSTEMGFVDGKNSGQMLSKLLMKAYEKPFAEEKMRFSWLTRDTDAVRAYVTDAYCGAHFAMSMAFEQSLFKWLLRINTRKRLLRIPQDMPILLASGDKDPVGGMGKNVLRLYNTLRQTGHANIALELYPRCRHMLLWEVNRDDIYLDILHFLDKCMVVESN